VLQGAEVHERSSAGTAGWARLVWTILYGGEREERMLLDVLNKHPGRFDSGRP
jgi:hypothetical protein